MKTDHTPSSEDYDRILLAHGGGGTQTRRLIRELFYPAFANPVLEQERDGAVFTLPGNRVACTIDSFVVDPLFFPGGNIGNLSVNGTVNDLACCGATPVYLCASFVLEEGLWLKDLSAVVQSMAKAAKAAGVMIIAGDTKVVESHKSDKMFITTSGIGTVPANLDISPLKTRTGDAILISGPIGEHGVAVLAARDRLEFEIPVKSDTAPLNEMIGNLTAAVPDIHVLRDPSRGGLSGALNEIAATAGVTIEINEQSVPVSEGVTAACEMLGIDPLYMDSEGVVLVFVPEEKAVEACRVLRSHPRGRRAAVIGRVTGDQQTEVRMKTVSGGTRILDMVFGEQLPRIC